MKRSLMVFVPLLALAATASSCNVYKFVDSPSGDAQKLSAARAAFDSGDLDTAAKYYQELCSGSANETGETACGEDAFRLLDKNGIGMGTFIQFALDIKDGAGTALTKLAKTIYNERVSSGDVSTGLERRKDIQKAIASAAKISDPSTKGFVQFVTGIAMVGEILSEAVDSTGKLPKALIAQDPTTCETNANDSATGLPTCILAYAPDQVKKTACAAPANGPIASDASDDLETTAPKDTETKPTMDNINDAIRIAYNGVQSLGVGSDSKSSTINNLLSNLRPSRLETQSLGILGEVEVNMEGCYRQQLLAFKIGE